MLELVTAEAAKLLAALDGEHTFSVPLMCMVLVGARHVAVFVVLVVM